MDKTHTFKLTIKTPDATEFEGAIQHLLVDTEEGKMMVLPHHTSLVGSISFSNLEVCQGDRVFEFSVRNGFIYVNSELNTTEIFCLNCEKTQTVKYTSVESYLKFLEEELKSSDINKYQLEFLENEKFAVVKQLGTIQQEK